MFHVEHLQINKTEDAIYCVSTGKFTYNNAMFHVEHTFKILIRGL